MPPYVLLKKCIDILAVEMANPGNRHCANCIGALSFPVVRKHISSGIENRSYTSTTKVEVIVKVCVNRDGNAVAV